MVDLQESTYEVHGASVEELGMGLRSNDPRPFLFQWRIQWEHRFNEVASGSLSENGPASGPCRTSKASVLLTYVRVVPVWDADIDAPDGLRSAWDAYVAGVEAHDLGHREIAVATARELITRLRDLELPSCLKMGEAVRRLANQVIADGESRDREYDVATQHGVVQGAAWP